MHRIRPLPAWILILPLLFPFWLDAAPAADFIVATNGNDAWSGTLAEPAPDAKDGPFRTLERGREALRQRNRPGGTVLVRQGLYPRPQPFGLVARDSGTPESPTVFQAWPGEQAILAGAVPLPAAAFTPVTNAAILGRLDPGARDAVRQAHLPSHGIRDLGQFPVKSDGGPAIPELFSNGRRMTLARWPDEGWATIARIVKSGSDYSGNEPGEFEYEGDRPARWRVEDGVWLHGYWAFDWNAEILQVKSIDPQARRIGLASRAIYSIKQGNPSPRRYFAFNILEELDRPGEYVIDRRSGILYFWPPEDPRHATMLVSTLRGPVVYIADATNLVFRGFIVDATQGDGVDIHRSHRVAIEGCEIRNALEMGARIYGGTSNRIDSCDIHDTGKGGIVLQGGDRRTLTPAGNEAVNNHIWRFACHKFTYSDAIRLEGVGNRAARNLIHDTPHQAIGIDGNDHVFESNVIHHVATATDDCGALYKGRNPSCRGNLIRHNFWHHIGTPMGHGTAAVYFDDGDGGDRVIGNVFYRCGATGRASFGAVFSHGGHDNIADSNIFIKCHRALGSSPWSDEQWAATLKRNGGEGWTWPVKLLQEVDITRAPYTNRYPELAGFMDPPPGQERINRARHNVMVDCGEASIGSWRCPPDANVVTNGDPGFVNAAAGDFRLKPDSDIFKRLPGFRAPPLDGMGLYTNALRPRLPDQAWAP